MQNGSFCFSGLCVLTYSWGSVFHIVLLSLDQSLSNCLAPVQTVCLPLTAVIKWTVWFTLVLWMSVHKHHNYHENSQYINSAHLAPATFKGTCGGISFFFMANLSNLCKPSQIVKFMGPTWGPSGSCRPQMGPMLAPWTLLSGLLLWWMQEQESLVPGYMCQSDFLNCHSL